MDSTKFKKYAKCSISFHTISYKNHLCSQIRFSTSPFFHVWMTKMLAPAPVSRSRSATFQRPQMSARRRSFHPLLHHRLDVKRHRNRCSAISPSNAYLGMLKNVERVQFFMFGWFWWGVVVPWTCSQYLRLREGRAPPPLHFPTKHNHQKLIA